MKIHPTALVHKKARLGKNVEVGPFSVIEENASVGDNTVIGSHVMVLGNTAIGRDCQIFTGAVVGSRPQDLKYKGEKSFLEIGDHNIIREFNTINPGTGEGGKTVIGNHNLMMAYVHIAHDCKVGNHCIIVNNGTLGGHVVVEDHVLISGLSGVHQFVRIGTFAIVGGCSKVVRDIPPYCTADGHPARIYGLNLIGLRRNNVSKEALKSLDRAFKILFNSGAPVKITVEKLAKEKHLTSEVAHLVEFIKSSSRGISRSCRTKTNIEE